MAANFDSLATVASGLCFYTILGCTDSTALNFQFAANADDGSCTLPRLGCVAPEALNFDSLANTFVAGGCVFAVRGCTDSLAINYVRSHPRRLCPQNCVP